MNLNNLSKEKKQYIILGALVVVALAVIGGFGIKVSLSSIADAKLELLDISSKVEGAERSLARQGQLREDLAASTAILKKHLEDAPPPQNYYSWATEVIYAEARLAGLEIDSIDEQSRVQADAEEAKNTTLKLESYSLRIGAHGGYADLKHFLVRIEEHHPLARVTAVEISTGAGPEIHSMELHVQWPFNLDKVEAAWADIEVQAMDEETSVTQKNMPTPPPPRPGSTSKSVES